TLPCYIVTDGIRLRQILFNLLGNAIKFTAKGTIKLAVRKCAENESNNSIDIAFSVEDTGIGIPAHQMGAVFDAFTQQKGQDPSKYGGTGLGLAITKRLVEIMAGTITVESEVGKGSTFKVTLKSVPTATVEHEPGSDNSHGIDNIRFDGAEVLVADDLDTNRLLIKKFLEPLGIRVREATDGKAAVDSARLHHPGVVVMDVRMPLMDGFEATQSIKNDDQLNDIAVIVLTASAMKSDEVAAQKSGADSYITKPVNYVQLVTQLQRFLPYTRGGKETADQLTETETVYTEKKTLSPGLPEALETELSDTWESIRGVYIFDDIDTFATRVIKLGEENSLEILTR
ncbi:MAG: response regulator, partial [bacterium]|nr:response regulator [bacterium]